jgi:integrase
MLAFNVIISLTSCPGQSRYIVTFILNTGCGKGEILSLKCDDPDLKHGFVLLEKTKNGDRREIQINSRVFDAEMTDYSATILKKREKPTIKDLTSKMFPGFSLFPHSGTPDIMHTRVRDDHLVTG